MHMTPVIVLFASVLSGGAPADRASPWGVFSVASADARETTQVEISPVVITNTAEARPETTWIHEKTERVWMAQKRVVKAGAPATLQWADSRTCYQIIETLATLIDLDQPAGAPVLRVEDRSNAGVAYRIEAAGLSAAKGDAAAVRLMNGKALRAGAVVQAALDTWRPCWSDTPPTLSGAP